MRRITFIRHGRSLADDENKFEGRYDSPLTDRGIEQATNVANEWKNNKYRNYDLIVCSPLIRARKTAEIFSDIVGGRVVEENKLMEIDPGKLSGLPKEEGMKKYPAPSFANPYERIIEGTGESEAQIHARALLGIETVLNQEFENCLVVSHGAILNAVIREIFGIPIPVNRNGTLFKFGDLSYLDTAYADKNHRWIVLGFTTNWDK